MRQYTNPMDDLSQCRAALQDAHQEIVDLKAKLAALVEAADDVGGALRDIAADAHDVYLSNLDAAIAAAKGGMS